MALGERRSVVVAAGGSSWEPDALAALAAAGIVVVKRCVDVTDLIATAAAGTADVAVVDGRLPGLDADAVARLAAARVPCVAVAAPDDVERLGRCGVSRVLTSAEQLPGEVHAVAGTLTRATDPVESGRVVDPTDRVVEPIDASGSGHVTVVWGGGGAPGRTTVALGLAAERAAAGSPSVVLDLDPYHGAVAQHLGILDLVSGLLAAARRVNEGTLDPAAFADCLRRVAPGLLVLTGLPRPDRWVEVRAGVTADLVDHARSHGDVFVDTGFSLEDDRGPVGRNQLTLDAVDLADTLLVVGSADPTGLTRLARAAVEARERRPDVDLHVVVNRMRDSLGWAPTDIVAMIEGYVRDVPVHFLGEDQAALDKALVAGRSLPETGESAIRRDLRALLDRLAQLPKSSQSPPPV